MKGTPFYTGSEAAFKGPAEDRVNLWPLVYYRQPTWSILWPLIERSDDRFALRPFYSAYDLDQKRPVYNVLWPLAQFDRQAADNRVFPVFWGDDYAVLFPFYWHSGSPWARRPGHDLLIPLWSLKRSGPDRFSLYAPWPLVRFWKQPDGRGWYAWPLAGTFRHAGDCYRYQAWPLAHQWTSSPGDSRGFILLPLFGYYRDREGSLFLSLPWSSRSKTDGSSWQVLPPVYWREKNRYDSRLMVLPWVSGGTRDGRSRYHGLFPVYFRSTGEPASRFYTVLGGFTADRFQRDWLILPLLAKGHATARDSEYWWLGPLAHFKRSDDRAESYAFPFYLSSRNGGDRRFLSLPWSSGSGAQGESWQLVPPLMYHGVDRQGSLWITPLWARGADSGGTNVWQVLAPLFYSKRTADEHLLATLLGGYRQRADGHRWMIYPLLSWGGRNARGSDYWLLAPLIHYGSTPEGRSHHVFPLYYFDEASRRLASPLFVSWKGKTGTTTLVPPLLSYVHSSPGYRDAWLAAGLVRYGWGERAGPRHVLPLFYSNPDRGTVLSPLYARWKKGNVSRILLPLLLSGGSSGAGAKTRWGFLGLYSHGVDAAGRERGHCFPFYSYAPDGKFYTPLVGWNNRTNGYQYLLTPLAGLRRGDTTGGWLFPLFSRRVATGEATTWVLWNYNHRNAGRSRSVFFPFYGYTGYGAMPAAVSNDPPQGHYGKDLFYFPICWYRHETTVSRQTGPRIGVKAGAPASGEPPSTNVTIRVEKSNGVFPFWRYASTEKDGQNDANASVLFWLYRYQREVRPGSDHALARVLFWLYRYERDSGKVTVDVFPSITYDRKPDGFRKISFLWRCFRYERDGQGRKKLDLLFIPVLRQKGHQ